MKITKKQLMNCWARKRNCTFNFFVAERLNSAGDISCSLGEGITKYFRLFIALASDLINYLATNKMHYDQVFYVYSDGIELQL